MHHIIACARRPRGRLRFRIRRRDLGVAAAIFLAAMPVSTAAQNINDSFTPFAASYDLRDLEDDGAGHLWIASAGGALRFDETNGEWTHYYKELGTGPRGNDLTTVSIDSGGRIWVGSGTRGFTFFDPVLERWDRDSEEWPDPRIRVIRSLGTGVYIGTQNGLSLKPTATRTDICADTDPSCIVPSYVVNDYALTGDTLWVATQKGLGRFNGSSWDTAGALPPGSVGPAALSLALHEGVLWEATPTEVRRLVGGAWEPFAMVVNRLVITEGTLYAVASRHVYIWSGTDWTEMPVPLDAGVTIRDVEVVVGYTFFALSSGLGMITPGGTEMIRFYPPGPGLVGVFSGMTVDRKGVMWAGTSEGPIGIVGFDGSTWSQIYASQGGLISQWIFDVEADPTDALWVAHCCCPVPASCPMQIQDGAGFQDFPSVLNARVLVPDGASRMWVGTAGDGVVVMERDATSGAWAPAFSLTPESTGGVMASGYITALAVTSDGTYIGHIGAGVDYWPHNGNLNSGRNGQGWTHVGTGGFGLLDANVGAMTSVGSDVWVGTSGGLHRFRRGILLERCPTRNRHDPGDPARRVTSMVPDGLGGIWMGTDTGVLYLPRGGTCDVDGGDFAVFNEANSPLPNNRVTAAALSPTDGSVWMGTASGLLRIDPSVYSGSEVPDRYVIYPNPLDLTAGSASRTVTFGIVIGDADVASAVPADAVSQPEIFDLAGRRVGSFARRSSTGSGSWAWTGTNTYGDFVAPGIYIVRTRTTGGEVVTRKVGVLR